jgi:hypothetical protein
MSEHKTLSLDDLPPIASEFYCKVMSLLREANILFLVGGGHAFHRYTTIARDTKDFDIFVMPVDAVRVLDVLHRAGYQTDHKYPHWLGKVYHEGYFVDVISSSGNGLCSVDLEWFENAMPDTILGQQVNLIPVEEMIWQKAFIMERHRFDGSDVMHLLHYHSERLDWTRLLHRFSGNWLVILSHLTLYRFAYPDDESPKANAILKQLATRLASNLEHLGQPARHWPQLCRGTLLSLLDFLPAVEHWGYVDARLQPLGNMTPAEVAHWTAHFER